MTQAPNQKYADLLSAMRDPHNIDRPGAGIIEPRQGVNSTRTLEISSSLCHAGGVITLPHIAHCKCCDGAKSFYALDAERCPNCSGQGKIYASKGLTRVLANCGSCLGTGRSGATPCPDCQSIVNTLHGDLEISIPSNFDASVPMTVAGYGVPGQGGGNAGDLIVVFSVQPMPA